MDKAKLEQRLVELRASLKQVEANGNALIGAIQECEYWLIQIEQPKPPKAESKKQHGE